MTEITEHILHIEDAAEYLLGEWVFCSQCGGRRREVPVRLGIPCFNCNLAAAAELKED